MAMVSKKGVEASEKKSKPSRKKKTKTALRTLERGNKDALVSSGDGLCNANNTAERGRKVKALT